MDDVVLYTSLIPSNGTLYYDNSFYGTSGGFAQFENIELCGESTDVDMNYSWSNGASTPTITANTAGTYIVTVTDDNGCTDSAQAMVTLNPNPNDIIVIS